MRPGRIEFGDVKYITKAFHDKSTKSQLKPGDIAIVRVGQNRGDCAVIPEGGGEVNCANIVFARLNDNRYSQFVGAFFNTELGRSALMSVSTGSAQGVLNTKSIAKVLVPVPPADVAFMIGNMRKVMDSKITLNTQTNQTLEQMAQALFKSWFVDFDPVIDNALAANGGDLNAIPEPLRARASARQALFATSTTDNNSTESRAATASPATHSLATKNSAPSAAPASLPALSPALSSELCALFPASFEQHDELGWIPEGWAASRLDSVLELAYGKALKKTDRIEGQVPVYGSGGVGGFHNQRLVEGPGVIVGRKGTVGSLFWEDRDFFPIDTVFYVKPFEGIPLGYCFELLKTFGLEHMNTDAAVPGLNRNNAYRLLFPKPSGDVMDAFARTINVIKALQNAKSDESSSLMQLRDTLLPKLLSGELTLSEAAAGTETQP